METQIKSFIEYWFKFGFLSNTNINEFMQIFNIVINSFDNNTDNNTFYLNEIYTREIISTTLVKFLNSLSETRKQWWSVSIFNKFKESQTSYQVNNIPFSHTEINTITVQERLSNLSFIYQKQSIKGIFNKWRMKTNLLRYKQWVNNQQDQWINYQKNQIPLNRVNIARNHSRSKSKSNSRSKLNLRNKRNTIETSDYLREQEELSHCTFRPKINEYYQPYNWNYSIGNNNNPTISTISVHERLYTDSKKIKNKNDIRQIEKDTKESQMATFQPSLISHTPKTSNISTNNFNERWVNFEKRKHDNIQKISSLVEGNYSSKCSFSPNIEMSQRSGKHTQNVQNNNTYYNNNNCYYYENSKNNSNKGNSSLSHSYSSGKLPVYERLFNYGEEKRKRNVHWQNKITNELKELASSPSTKSLKGGNEKDTVVNYRKIEEWYKDYKKHQNKVRIKQNELDIEQGITFKPELYTNEKYYDRINPDFYERERKNIDDKQNFITLNNKITEENLKRSKWGYGKYSNKEKEEISQSIIDRLYLKGLEKYTERKGTVNPYWKNKVQDGDEKENPDNASDEQQLRSSQNLNGYSVSQLPIAYDNNKDK